MARGDHFFVWRRFGVIPFQHHAIDLGDGDGIHFSDGSGGVAGPAGRVSEFVVAKLPLVELTLSGKNRPHVVKHKTLASVDEIVARAESQIGRRGYHLFHDNCEHFAAWCVTGTPSSVQVNSAATRAGSVAVKTTVVVAARIAVKSTRLLRPWTLAADAVQFGTEAIGQHVGLTNPILRKQASRVLGGMTALGIGALTGPVGIAVTGGTWVLGELGGELMLTAIDRNKQVEPSK